MTAVANGPVEEMEERGRFIDVGGLSTHYHDQGEGPVVVLIHGSGPGVTAHVNWQRVFPTMSHKFRVVALDMLGFGYTEVPEDVTYDVDAWVTHLTRFLDALGIDRCSVVGNSYGGAIAMHLALRSPERVERLVLMGSAGLTFDMTEGLQAAWGYQPSRENMRDLLYRFAHDPGLVNETLVENRFQATLRPGVQEAFSAMFPEPRQEALDALALDAEEVGRIDCEALVVHGRDDEVVPAAVSERIAELLPHSRLHVFPDCGHWVQIEKATEFEALVSSFLGATESVETASRP